MARVDLGAVMVPVATGCKRSFIRSCYAARHWPQTQDTHQLGLAAPVAQGLSDLLPVLLCGEASAELVFESAVAAFSAKTFPVLHLALQTIAADEKRHGVELAALRQHLPTPATRTTARYAAHFLRGLASDDLAIHLARVAAIDAGVCLVLAEVCRKGAPIAANIRLNRLFTRIRQDEGRHVRISRQCAAVLGINAAAERSERKRVLSGFSALLRAQDAAFFAIGVDPAHLRERFEWATGSRATA